MTKIIISYQTIEKREQILKALSTGVKIKKISKPYRKGLYKRIYIDID
ncbi:hypothetical protein SNUCP2_00350 [Clostridium perfringens A]|nr:hypothetical protein [Clostridium perfringens]HBC2034783.1 hypothetical protein [Clostridium perfringens]HBC2057931.1 hypothetical protein [Clostridium perfringens]HBC2072088.1 hypothetical protein [Clostridium perfringens]